MADVFISYSRKDRSFVLQLHNALAKINRDTWVDWEDIPLTAEWLKEIYSGIESADNFVFVISPDSVASETCNKEIAHAVAHNKRLVPIMRRDVPDKDVPEALRSINWIFFRETDNFDSKFEELIKALDTNLDWVHQHTRLLVRAIEWNRNHRDSLLLRGRDLRDAEEWLAQETKYKEPTPTPLQRQYILSGRKSAIARQRTTFALVISGLLIMVVLAVFGLSQLNQASSESNKRSIAESNATSREIASVAVNQLKNDPELSVLLSLEAEKSAHTFESEDSLRQALIASSVRKVLVGHSDIVYIAQFSPDGNRILTGSFDDTAGIWDATTGKQLAVLIGVRSAQFSPDGKQIVSAASQAKIAQVWDTNGREFINSPYALA